MTDRSELLVPAGLLPRRRFEWHVSLIWLIAAAVACPPDSTRVVKVDDATAELRRLQTRIREALGNDEAVERLGSTVPTLRPLLGLVPIADENNMKDPECANGDDVFVLAGSIKPGKIRMASEWETGFDGCIVEGLRI